MNHKNRSFRDVEIRSFECIRVLIINQCGLGRAIGEQMKLCSNDGWCLWQPYGDTWEVVTFLETTVLSIADFSRCQDKKKQQNA